MRSKCFVLVLVCFVFGCSQSKQIHPAFYDVVKDHRVLLEQTNNAVIASIQDELNQIRHRLDPQQIQSVENLIKRLEFLKLQGVVIEKYLDAEFVDENLIAELIKNRWISANTP